MPSANSYYPLPVDYGRLTQAGQRAARLAVARDRSTIIKAMEGWVFFRHYYLSYPGLGFYPQGIAESPAFHYDMIRDYFTYMFTVTAAPRGSAKSTLMCIEMTLLNLITIASYSAIICTSSDKLIQPKMTRIMLQISENPRILEDFGKLAPKRGSNRPWSHHLMHLANNSILEAFSIGARQLGARPFEYFLDDVEYDPEKDTVERRSELCEHVSDLLLRVILPMLPPEGRIHWTGTLLDRGSFLYHVLTTKDDKFKYWNRRIITAGTQDPDTGRVIVSNWPEYWTVDWLEHRRKLMGDVHFSSEYMNNPISKKDRVFAFDWDRCGYTYDKAPEYKSYTEPHLPPADATVTWYKYYPTRGEKVAAWLHDHKNARELFDNMYRVSLLDFAYTLAPSSDYSCVAIMGIDRSNVWWILDMWLGRLPKDKLMELLIVYSAIWQVRLIGVESMTIQKELPEVAMFHLQQLQGVGAVPSDWAPKVVGVTYPPNTTKPMRIEQLEWRFRWGMLKFPKDFKREWPYTELMNQIEDFTLDLKMLRFDDAVDTLSMLNYVIHGQGSAPGAFTPPAVASSILEDLKEGPVGGITANMITDKMVEIALDREWQRSKIEHKGGSPLWDRPAVVGY